MIDLTLENPQVGTWRVVTADGMFDYIPERYRSARVRFHMGTSPWAQLLKLIRTGQFHLVDARGLPERTSERTRPTLPVREAPCMVA